MKAGADAALRLVPWDEVQALSDELVQHGFNDEEVRAHVVRLLDAALVCEVLPEPFGTAAELVDGPLIAAGLRLVLHVARVNPERRAARIARRAHRHAERAAAGGIT